jgi:hypothetical protein
MLLLSTDYLKILFGWGIPESIQSSADRQGEEFTARTRAHGNCPRGRTRVPEGERSEENIQDPEALKVGPSPHPGTCAARDAKDNCRPVKRSRCHLLFVLARTALITRDHASAVPTG